MKIFKYIIGVVAVTMTTMTFAQDGESLFKAKCNTCHMLGKNGTGPNLKGVKQQWEDAGEGEFIYEWVKNPQALVASGKSKEAVRAEGFSPSAMTPQAVTNEEIDAILSFVDNYEPPAENDNSPTASADGEEVIKYVPNYEKNLTLFYFLLIAIGIQMFVIIMMATSMKTFVELQQKKNSKGGSGAAKIILALVGFFGIIAATSTSHALTFVRAGENPELPWLLVEDYDLYILLAINLVMLALLLHFRRLFMDIAHMVRPPKEKEQKLSKRAQRKLNKVLTDAVDIEEEHTILLHHEYDGIKELDNNLPPWWVWGFYATIIFSVIYLFHYHILKTGDFQEVEYAKEVAAAQVEVEAYLKANAMNVDETSVTLMEAESDLSTGKVIFEKNCIACHNIDGGGNTIGPNLTDKAWIYGYDIKDVFTSVKYGRDNGMPEHNSKLNPIQLQQVASYVISLPEVDGREAQGEIIEE